MTAQTLLYLVIMEFPIKKRRNFKYKTLNSLLIFHPFSQFAVYYFLTMSSRLYRIRMKIVFPSRESYEHIPEWLLEAQRHIAPHQATLLLVGCKHDLASQGN